jgi:ketosteroid isomerase-like protein
MTRWAKPAMLGSMPSRRVRVAMDAYDAWNRGDFEAMVKNVAPDVEWVTSRVFPDFDRVYRGHDGMRRFWNTMHAAWEVIDVRPTRFVEYGDRILVELHFNGRGRESGVEVELDWAQVITYRDDQVARIAGYPSVDEARQKEALTERPADLADDRAGGREHRH